jgi:hypothetical protein
MAAATSIPFLGACIACLAALGAGAAAVWYHDRTFSPVTSGGTGAGLGAGAAAVAALVSGLIGGVLSFVGLRPGWSQAGERAVERMRQQGSPEQQVEMVRQMFESPFLPVAIVGCSLILYAILGAAGGAIGVALFGSDEGGGGQGVQTAEADVVE